MVIQIGKERGLEMVEKELKLLQLYAADELFLTGTTVEVLPVVRLDGKQIGTGRPGEKTLFLYRAFQEQIT
ncbi:MAG: hypothetical protein MPW15_15780 [Candidatus Manganitrophus sp.]|nr:hypothetical protein [Candidatus Manganitrophus sp.]